MNSSKSTKSREEIAAMALEIASKALAIIGGGDLHVGFNNNQPHSPAGPTTHSSVRQPAPSGQVRFAEKMPKRRVEEDSDEEDSEDSDQLRAAEMIEQTLEHLDDSDFGAGGDMLGTVGHVIKRRRVEQPQPQPHTPQPAKRSEKEIAESEEWGRKYKERRKLTDAERDCFLEAVDCAVTEIKKSAGAMDQNRQKQAATMSLRNKFAAAGYISGVTYEPMARGKYNEQAADFIHCAAAYYAESKTELKGAENRLQGRYGTIQNATKNFGKLLIEASPLSRAFEKGEPGDEPIKSEEFDSMVKDVAMAVFYMDIHQ